MRLTLRSTAQNAKIRRSAKLFHILIQASGYWVGTITGNPGIPSYIASKHGVIGLTRTAALEYVKKGIRVNAVNPGLIDTQVARDVVAGDEQAYGEIAKSCPRQGGPAEEIAAAVLWLCSPAASYVVGHALTVDGGMTVV